MNDYRIDIRFGPDGDVGGAVLTQRGGGNKITSTRAGEGYFVRARLV